jgi:uncharacterized protein YjdB
MTVLTWRINNNRTAIVTDDVKLLSIKEFPPDEGMKCLLANKAAGTSTVGQWNKQDTGWTHWFPMPTFPKEVVQTEK